MKAPPIPKSPESIPTPNPSTIKLLLANIFNYLFLF